MTNEDLDEKVELLSEDSKSVTVRISKTILESQLSWVRYAELTPKDIETILKLETSAFTPEEGGTQDPPETYEGIERFLKLGGDVLILSRANAFLEKISLEHMLSLKYDDLSAESPLRQIAERDVLQNAKSYYSQTDKELWYLHGVGTAIKKLGDGSIVTAFALRRLLGTLADEQKVLDEKIHFGYIDIGPTRDNINIPSFKMFFKLGAVLNGYEKEVYTKGVPYLRVSHGANYKLSQDDRKIIDLSKRTYKNEIRKALDTGYIGTELKLDRQTETYSMIFQKQINK